MVIEYLTFRVVPQWRERFVQTDEKIWTTLLSSCPGFISKEVWISPDHLEEVTAVIRWDSMDAWDAVPPDRTRQADAEFSRAMGKTFELTSSRRYQVRKMAR